MTTRALTERFTEAVALAASIHRGQTRKGTDTPALAHLIGVAAIALEFGAGEDEAIAALLHDAIEDAPKEMGAEGVRRVIRQRFGPSVLQIVEGCTDADTHPKPAWHARKEQYIERLAHEGPSTLRVSASDKLHNCRAILADYRTHGDALFRRFNRDAGKEGTVGYYRGLVDAYRARCAALGADALGEVPALVRELDLAVTALEEATGVRGRWPARCDGVRRGSDPGLTPV